MTIAIAEKPKKSRKPRPSPYDETFTFMSVLSWSIQKANVILDKGGMDVTTLKVGEHIQTSLGITGSPHKTRKQDLTSPCIVLNLREEIGMLVIDGHHRVRAAHEQGIEELPCVVFTAEQEKSIRFRGCPWRDDFISSGETCKTIIKKVNRFSQRWTCVAIVLYGPCDKTSDLVIAQHGVETNIPVFNEGNE